ncbi:UNVERIFIED_CONTAM: hypothetical protein Slati_3937100 [Sesamum latifolium]|uniref:Aminotransferase-like plant mobile domain-containing protein n=1 Tax=Sesamum latifolium TaxID=2727402 RepID=A0AAW2TNB7_9LAMI
MVYFKDKSSPSGEHHLILDDQHQPMEKGTILAVYTPSSVVETASKVWTLRAAHHELPRHQQSNDLAPLRTLDRSIVEGDAKWDGDLQFTEGFHYTKGYWEWTEDVLSRCGKRLRPISAYDVVYTLLFTYDHNSDIIKAFCEAWCPLTNTLLTSAGELSISLWDLYDLAGLSMMGCLYDEVVPSALELIGADEKGGGSLLSGLLSLLALHVRSPGKDVNSIRPSTFKMASMMANGRRVSLAIPVLTSIYEGLNIIASSSRPARTSPSFPVHFVYAWLASYFKTHYPIWQGLCGPKMTRFSGEGGAKYYDPQEARKRIHKAEFVFWACNMIVMNRPFKFIDNGDAELDHDYFIAIRSSYLTLRQGDKFIIEPYSPHRFGHQFGPKPTNITIKRKKYEDEQVDGENNPPYAPVPSIVVKSNSQAVAVEASKGKGEIQSVDASEESETSDSWTTTPPPFGMDLKESNFHSLLQFDFLSSIEDDVFLILKAMKIFHKFDITSVEESLNTFFVKVRAYDEARSLSSQKLSRSLHEQHLNEAKARLQDVQTKASEGASKVQSIVDELEHVEKEIVALKGRRTSLSAALKEQKQLNHDAQIKIHEVEEDIATLDNTVPLDDAIVEDSKANVEILKEDLNSLKPFA